MTPQPMHHHRRVSSLAPLVALLIAFVGCDPADSTNVPRSIVIADDRVVELVDIATGTRQTLVESTAAPREDGAVILTVLRSPARSRTLIGSLAHPPRVFGSDGGLVAELRGEGLPLSAAFVGWIDESHILMHSQTDSGGLQLFHIDLAERRTDVPIAAGDVAGPSYNFALSTNGGRVAIASAASPGTPEELASRSDGVVTVHDSHSGKLLGRIPVAAPAARFFANWTRDGRLLVFQPGAVTVYSSDLRRLSTRALPERFISYGPWGNDAVVMMGVTEDPVRTTGELVILPLAGGDAQPLWLAEAATGWFTPSPRADQVVFGSMAGLELADLDGTNRRLVLPGAGAKRVWW